jgi:hypothetical protein
LMLRNRATPCHCARATTTRCDVAYVQSTACVQRRPKLRGTPPGPAVAPLRPFL